MLLLTACCGFSFCGRAATSPRRFCAYLKYFFLFKSKSKIVLLDFVTGGGVCEDKGSAKEGKSKFILGGPVRILLQAH